MTTVEVKLAARAYPITIGRGLAGHIAGHVAALRAAGRKVAVITDARLLTVQSAFLTEAFGAQDVLVHSVPSGEPSKSFAELERCCDALIGAGLDRGGVVFAVGGGVVGDLAGFAAASYLRGIDFYQVPTTLLAMVDSSVGGKTGINLRAGKNLVGAFHQPKAVYADLDCLATLAPREFAAGMAEVIKHGLLADAALFERLEGGARLTAASAELEAIVARNCEIKASVVAADEREQAAGGGRALLNLGHTFGHAIEAVAGYGRYLHGEAVAVGLVLAGALSARLGMLGVAEAARIAPVVARYGLPTQLDASAQLDIEALLAAMHRDKKASGGDVKFVLLEAIGRAVTRRGVDWAQVRAVWGMGQAL